MRNTIVEDGINHESAPIDAAALLGRLNGDSQLLSELAVIFRSDVPLQIEKIRAAISASDGKGVEMAAHALKGAASVLFASPLADAARGLEGLGRSGQLTGATTQLEALEKEWARLKPKLNELCIQEMER